MRVWFGEQMLGRSRAEVLHCLCVHLLGAPADNGEPSVEIVHPLQLQGGRWLCHLQLLSQEREQVLMAEQAFDYLA